MRISLCTPCMGRLSQLKKTFPKNLEAAKAFGLDKIEFVILNWRSNDGLELWLKNNYSDLIEAGTLKYLATWEPKHYHMARTKNITHKTHLEKLLLMWMLILTYF